VAYIAGVAPRVLPYKDMAGLTNFADAEITCLIETVPAFPGYSVYPSCLTVVRSMAPVMNKAQPAVLT
jgi:hypothetical protein